MALLSTIIPIFNAENTIRRCLDSIVVQDLSGFEIILVDDGSTDTSLSICEDYLSVSPEIKLIHKCNGGVSSARNAGLDVASGEWITFIDSDDTVSQDWAICLRETVNGINGKNDTLIIEDVLVRHVDGHCCQIYSNKQPKNFIDVFSSDFAGSVCNKVFRKEIIDKLCLRFDENLKFCEDCIFVAVYSSRMNRIHLIGSPIYVQYLPESYGGKYAQYINYDFQFQFYQKIRDTNIIYARCMVDGLFMCLTSSPHIQNRASAKYVITQFKEVVGSDIKYVKGLKKCFIRSLSQIDNNTLWYFAIMLFIKLRNEH